MKVNKKWVILGLLGVLGLTTMSFVSAKKSQAREIFKQIQFRIQSIRRIRIADSKLKFDVDLSLQNPTAQDFTLSLAGLIKAKVLRVFRGNTLLSVGSLNDLQSVNLSAGGRQTFTITAEIPLLDLAKELGNIAFGNDIFAGIKNLIQQGNIGDHFKNINWNQVVKELRYEVDIEAFGNIYTFRP